MNITVKLTAALLTIGLLAGCAGPNQRAYQDYTLCSALGGAVGGAAVGAAASGGSGAVGGAAVGAMLALLLCPTDEAQAEEVAAEKTMCEHEPVPGALLDANGCAMDSDNDGVVDGIDMCANTPAGVTVDDVGCPIDSDRDGVADYKDLCPITPEGVIVDQDGCPIAGETILSLNDVHFEFDKATLTPEAQSTLDEAVDALLNSDEVVEVRVAYLLLGILCCSHQMGGFRQHRKSAGKCKSSLHHEHEPLALDLVEQHQTTLLLPLQALHE